MESERSKFVDRATRKHGLDLSIKEHTEQLRHLNDERSKHEKTLDKLARDLKRKEMNCDAVKQDFPKYIDEKVAVDKKIVQQDEESRRQVILVDEIQNEVDIFIGAYLKQEWFEWEKKDEYDVLNSAEKEMRADLVNLAKQNAQWENHLKFLQQSLEKLNRDLTVATKLCKETWDEVQMKELQEFDLRKQLTEVN